MPGDTKVLYTDEFTKDVAKIKDNLIRSRIKKLVQQLIDNPKETADEGQTLKNQLKTIEGFNIKVGSVKLTMKNPLLEKVEYKIESTKFGVWRHYLCPTGIRNVKKEKHVPYIN
jgi:mRNA-degrading endonuclease RelE of RelBE toxin-antitoxin system